MTDYNYDLEIERKYHPENFGGRMRECDLCGQEYDIDSAEYKTDDTAVKEGGQYICPPCWDN